MFRLYVLLGGVIILSACDVGKDYTIKEYLSYDEIRQTLKSNDKTEYVDKNWYEVFGDKDLNTLLTQIKKSNLTIAQSKERLLQARYLFFINSKNYLPTLDGNFEYDFSKTNNKADSINNSDFFRFGFDASWEIDLWGMNKNISKQYVELINKADYNVADIVITIESEVISNYVYLRLAQEKLKITKKNISLQEDVYKIVKNKYLAGTEDELALNQALYLLEKTKADIPDIIVDIEKYKNALYVLSGKTKNNFIINLDKFDKNITKKTFKYNVQKLYQIPLDSIRTRPDVKIAEAQVKAQNASLNQSIIALFPSISLQAGFGFLSPSGNTLFNNQSEIYGYNPIFSVPIWQWGKLTNNIELQKHIREEYILNYNEVMLTALFEIKNSITNIEQALKEASLLKKSYESMKNVFEITKSKYKNGLVDFVEVTESEKNFLEAENVYLKANAKVLLNITSFYKATGGGYNFRNQVKRF